MRKVSLIAISVSIGMSSLAQVGDFIINLDQQNPSQTSIKLVDKENGENVLVDLHKEKIKASKILAKNPRLRKRVQVVKRETVQNAEFNESLNVLRAELQSTGKELKNPTVYIDVSSTESGTAQATEFRAQVVSNETSITVSVNGTASEKLQDLPEVVRDQVTAHNYVETQTITPAQAIAIGAGFGALAWITGGVGVPAVVAIGATLAACGSGGDGGDGGNTPVGPDCSCQASLSWQAQPDAEKFICFYAPAGTPIDDQGYDSGKWKECGEVMGLNATEMVMQPFPDGTWEIALRAARWSSFNYWIISGFSQPVQFTSPRPK